mmetsp:Transcript_36180/g.108162  ORF Transcript_36180/g.108162 Transcript_36180/m.108162 type:complete len:211 (-) Transcript_36180:48-680(-)
MLWQCCTSLAAVHAAVDAAPGIAAAWVHAPRPARAGVERTGAARTNLEVELVAGHVMSRVHGLRDDVSVDTLNGQPEARAEATLRVAARAVGANSQVHGIPCSITEGGLRSQQSRAPEGPVHAGEGGITAIGNRGVRGAVVPSLPPGTVAHVATTSSDVEAAAAPAVAAKTAQSLELLCFATEGAVAMGSRKCTAGGRQQQEQGGSHHGG